MTWVPGLRQTVTDRHGLRGRWGAFHCWVGLRSSCLEGKEKPDNWSLAQTGTQAAVRNAREDGPAFAARDAPASPVRWRLAAPSHRCGARGTNLPSAVERRRPGRSEVEREGTSNRHAFAFLLHSAQSAPNFREAFRLTTATRRSCPGACRLHPQCRWRMPANDGRGTWLTETGHSARVVRANDCSRRAAANYRHRRYG